jgi:hypothetical protein
MRRATKTVATWFGISAGIAGLEHGYFEILQGSVRPAGLMILSMGPPCVPEKTWSGCELAMTILHNFLLTGILAMLPLSVYSAYAHDVVSAQSNHLQALTPTAS